MYKKTLLCLELLLSLAANAQGGSKSLSSTECSDLQETIYHYFERRVPESSSTTLRYMKDRPAELFFCVFDVDSSGKVTSLSVLSDDKNKDSAFAVLSKMCPQDFKDWHCEMCGGKTLMLNVEILNSNDNRPSYFNNVYYSYFFKASETNNLVMVGTLSLGWGEITCQFQGSYSILDSTENSKPQPVKAVKK